MHLGSRHDVEGKRQQRVTDKNCGRLVEGLVHGRPSAPQIVVVHGRQIVMDQRIAVHEFERGAGHQRARARSAEHRGGLDQQKWPQAFAAIQRCMAHGRDQPRRPRDFPVERRVAEEPLEQRFGLGGDRGKPGGKVGDTLVHRGIVSRCA